MYNSSRDIPLCERMIYALRGIRPNEYNAKCAEVNVMNRAIELGIDVRGGSISTSYVGGPKHGMEHTPCDVCAEIIDFFEIIYNGGW